MKDSCWLIMTSTGIRRMAKGRNANWKDVQRPKLEKGEYAVLVSVEVPATAFNPRPLPSATIQVSEEQLVAPAVDVTIEDPSAAPPSSDPDLE
jgi:hypothetical protein